MTELTVTERARQVLKFDETKAKLADLAKVSKDITEVSNAEEREIAHVAMMRLASMRVTIEKTGKAGREDANRYSKAVIEAEKELIAIVSPEEKRLRELRDGWDQARERERAEKEQAEAKKIAEDNAGLERLHDILYGAFGRSSTQLAGMIEATGGIDVSIFHSDDARAKATELLITTVGKLNELLAAQKALEDQQAAKAAQEAAEREERENAAAIKAEADRQAQARADAEAKAKREEDDRLAMERRKALDEEADKQRAEQKRLDDERRELDRQKAEQAAKDVEAARVARLESLRAKAPVLVEAAINAVAFLTAKGFGDEEVCLNLNFAIEKYTVKKRTP